MFEAVQRGIDGALGEIEEVGAAHAQRLDDGVAVAGTLGQHRQQQRIEMPLQLLGAHT